MQFGEIAHIELASQFPETEPLREVVTAPCTREVSIELLKVRGKPMTAIECYWKGVTTAKSRKLLRGLHKLSGQ